MASRWLREFLLLIITLFSSFLFACSPFFKTDKALVMVNAWAGSWSRRNRILYLVTGLSPEGKTFTNRASNALLQKASILLTALPRIPYYFSFIAFSLSWPHVVPCQTLVPKARGPVEKNSCPKSPRAPLLRISWQPGQGGKNFTSSCSSSSRPCENVTSHSFIQNASCSVLVSFCCLRDSDALIELMHTPGKFICPLISSMLMLPSISSDNQELTIHRTVGDCKSTYNLMREWKRQADFYKRESCKYIHKPVNSALAKHEN